jgi:uncharacterized protein YdaU (DUF1376 family)
MVPAVMAALPYMPLFVADYLADAAHLTTTQHGAYLLLIFNYWQRGGALPDDDKRLASITRLGQREWARNRPVLEEFFTLTHGAWVHNRIANELARVADKSLKSKKAAQASVERRFSKRSADVEPTDTDNIQGSEANASASLQIIDAETVMWRQGKLYLQSQGVTPQRAGSLLGGWKKDYGPEAVIVALGKAQREGAIDPASFINACLGGKNKGYDRDRITV